MPRCTCRSISPGRTVRSWSSITSAPAGIRTTARAPIAERRSPSHTTAAASIGSRPVPSISRSATRATAWSGIGGIVGLGRPPSGTLSVVPAWAEIERKVFDGFFRFSPGYGRRVGDHAYDGRVGDASASTVKSRIREIDQQLGLLEGQTGLSRDQDVDRRAIMAQLRAQRFELGDLREPFRNPLFYAGWGTELDVSVCIKRAYAPLPVRLAALRLHLEGYPGVLEAARSNLEPSLPRPNLEIAIEATEGFSQYLASEVTAVARDHAQTVAAVGRAIPQLDAFAAWLRSRLPQAHDDYAL